MKIETVRDLIRALRSGKYTSIGSYPTYFITRDGEALSHEAIKENIWQVARATRDCHKGRSPDLRQWAIYGIAVNWEDPDLYCAHTNKRIESAYAGT
jgi:hypothetical protein